MRIYPFQRDRRDSNRNRRSGLLINREAQTNVITIITVKPFEVGSTPTVKRKANDHIRSGRGRDASPLQRSSGTDKWSRLGAASDADFLAE